MNTASQELRIQRRKGWEARTARLFALNQQQASANRIPLGTRFGTQVIDGYVRVGPRWCYSVRCDCGNEKIVQSGNLKKSKSCGCLTKKILSKAQTRHGETSSPTWNTWASMLKRCEYRGHKSWADYGGRGIKVCNSWHVYENFRADMGERPAGTQLDRVDNSRGYEPSNCRWATPRQNASNRRNSVVIEFNGERLTVSQWARRVGCSRETLHRRLKNWSIDEAMTRPLRVCGARP